MREGCVAAAAAAVDFAIGAFNIKPRAINGQASERARELAGRRRKARVRTKEGGRDGVVSEWKPCRVWADRHLHFHKLRSSER